MRGLDGKVVIVAGGGGIGNATALRLAQEGARVVLGDLFPESAEAGAAEVRSAGGQAVAARLDLADEHSVRGLVGTALDTYGRLDGLHANAAETAPEVVGHDSTAEDVPLEVFDRTLRVNLRGFLLCMRFAAPEIRNQGGGAIVCTSSAAAFVGEPVRPAYAASKSGINALVRHAASLWGTEGIRTNAVAPGLVMTPAVRTHLSEEFQQQRLADIRSPRLGRPEDIAAMVAFLLSEDAQWINGQVISVDGGGTLR